jgi:sirohydrochlorin ferrochelatase
VAIAPYLLAPGHFADRLAVAGADLVAEPLGAHPAVIELVLDRVASTRS